MDAVELISGNYLFSHQLTLEDRLKRLLNTLTYFLDLEDCSLTFSSAEHQDYRVVANDLPDSEQATKIRSLFGRYGSNAPNEKSAIFFREKFFAAHVIDNDPSNTSIVNRTNDKFFIGAHLRSKSGLLIK